MFFDRLDFSGQPTLTQWIKTLSQQVKALHLLRNEDCASKSEEIYVCMWKCYNVHGRDQALWFCHNGVKGWWHKWQEQLGISVSGDRISNSASAPFYSIEITYRWIISDLLLFVCTGHSGHSEKMDQLQLPEGFRPDFKLKYVFTY